MQDDDLSALDPLADYVVSLDLTNSKVTDEGLGLLLQMKNLGKVKFGRDQVGHGGWNRKAQGVGKAQLS